MNGVVNTNRNRPLRVLRLDASGRDADSSTRGLGDELVRALADRYGEIRVTRRDVAHGLPFINATWIGATFTNPGQRDDAQRQALAASDRLVRELQDADVLIIGAPIYNFSVPATLKAWIDLVARAGVTFRYTENGPVGLLAGKAAFVVVASGGVPVDSAADFATPYLRHVLGFLGIHEVEVIAADRQNQVGAAAVEAARERIHEQLAARRAA